MKPELFTDLLIITLRLRKTAENLLLGDRLMKAVRCHLMEYSIAGGANPEVGRTPRLKCQRKRKTCNSDLMADKTG